MTTDTHKKIIGKTKMFGDSITSDELLLAIKDKCFGDSDDAVLIHAPNSKSKYGEPIIFIFECTGCGKLHLLAGNPSADIGFNDSKFFKTYFNFSVEETEKEKRFVSRKKLISILENIPNNPPVTIGAIYKAENDFTLTEVVKCSADCFCIHLRTGYEKNSILRN